jgi:hypothetical protein
MASREGAIMSQSDKFRSNCEYYGRKCREQLHRTKLSRDLALHHLSQVHDSDAISQYQSLIIESLDPSDRIRSKFDRKLITVIVESHFLTLKVNFEFFLNRMLYCLWYFQFDKLAYRKKKGWLADSSPLREFAQSLSLGDGKEYIIGKIVCGFGLLVRSRSAGG